ncbi:MAG: hypothetical protein ACLP8S_22270 [Solirubrobacteraceae bacterium]
MGERPTITLIDNPVAVGGARPGEPAAPAASSRALRKEPSSSSAAPTETNPYAGQRKVQAPVRLFPPLWDRLEQLVRELREEGLEVDKTALLNAALHFHGPGDLDEARELVNRWRALLARPPARRT